MICVGFGKGMGNEKKKFMGKGNGKLAETLSLREREKLHFKICQKGMVRGIRASDLRWRLDLRVLHIFYKKPSLYIGKTLGEILRK